MVPFVMFFSHSRAPFVYVRFFVFYQRFFTKKCSKIWEAMVVGTEAEFFKIANFLLKISMIYIFRFIFFKYHIYAYVYDFI